MLKEIEGVGDEPRIRRRWFHDDWFDLFVWQTDDGDIKVFQLCYGPAASERALVWHHDGGFFHDGGEAAGSAVEEIAQRFEEAAGALPRKVRQFVGGLVRDYVEGRATPSVRRKQFRREGWQKARPAAAR